MRFRSHPGGPVAIAQLDSTMYVVSVGPGLFPGREVASRRVFHVFADVQEHLGVASRLRFDVVP